MPVTGLPLAGGVAFAFWNDVTRYTRVYHVAGSHGAASDSNPGTADRPFATIGRAAQVLQPAEKAVIHASVYREQVVPARGGDGPDRMIAYEAVPGETVRVTGAEPWAPLFHAHAGASAIRYGDIPETLVGGYNPFLAVNTCIALGQYELNWTCAERQRMLMRRGQVYADGRPLQQVYGFSELKETHGAFWVEEPGLRIHLRLWDDADPRHANFEITVREQVFAPRQPHVGYLRISGLALECGADGIPFPQRALLSTNWGHHWIIEDNTVRRANAIGIDVGRSGYQFFQREQQPSGGHILRRNTITECGLCGIAGLGGNDDTLVEDNRIEHIGGRVPERVWESAGIKFHFSRRVLVRRNLIRRLREACAVWFDVDARHCRISNNVFCDIATAKGAIQMECCCHAPNRIDGNVFWAITRAYTDEAMPAENPWRGGFGVYADTNDRLTIDHNLFGKIESYAVSLNLCQPDRMIGSRPGMCRHNRVYNNVFAGCAHAILMSRRENNRSNGNVFAMPAGGPYPSTPKCPPMCIQFPEPAVRLDLEGWQDMTGEDMDSISQAMEASFDEETMTLAWHIPGGSPVPLPQPAAPDIADWPAPGPLAPVPWQTAREGRSSRQPFAAKGNGSGTRGQA